MPTENYTTTPVPPHIKQEIHSLGEGASIVQKLLHDPLRAAMHSAADAGVPPATAVSGPLLDQLGPHISSHRYKRFIGACVSWILRSDGYEIKGQPSPIPGDRLFKTATRFVRRPLSVSPASPAGAGGDRFDLLRRITLALEPDELAFLADLASRAASPTERL